MYVSVLPCMLLSVFVFIAGSVIFGREYRQARIDAEKDNDKENHKDDIYFRMYIFPTRAGNFMRLPKKNCEKNA